VIRVVNRLLAVAAALTLAVGGLLVAIEILWAALGNSPWLIPYDDWYANARSNHWDSTGARSLFVGLVVAGLALLVLQLARPRPRSLPLDSGRARAGLARRSVEQALARAVDRQDGVAATKVIVGRRRTRISAVTRLTELDLRPRVEEAAGACLAGLGLGGMALSVDVQRERPNGGRRT
jgi:uncharacterized protein DUF6286